MRALELRPPHHTGAGRPERGCCPPSAAWRLQDASGDAARRSLLPTLEHLGRQLANPLSWQHRQLRNPLADVTLASLLRLSPPAALAVHNFCAAAQLVALGGSGGVEGVVVLHQQVATWGAEQRAAKLLICRLNSTCYSGMFWQDCCPMPRAALFTPVNSAACAALQHMLWSTLEPADGAAVYSLAATALLHPQSALQRGGIGEARCVAEEAGVHGACLAGCWATCMGSVCHVVLSFLCQQRTWTLHCSFCAPPLPALLQRPLHFGQQLLAPAGGRQVGCAATGVLAWRTVGAGAHLR